MAAGRKRWFAIGGATAAVAIGALGAVALGAPTNPVSLPPTNSAPQITWGEDDVGAGPFTYDVDRASLPCATAGDPDFGTPVVGTSSPFVDSPRPPDGIYCYRVTGRGYAGGDVGARTQVLVDATPPAVHISTPVAGLVRGTIQITASAPDAGSGLQSLALSVDSVIQPTQSNSLTWNTAVLGGDGAHTVRAHAVDMLGHAADDTVVVTVDNAPPAAPVVTPLQSPVAGSPTLSWQPAQNVTYTVRRTSSTGPGPRTFSGTVTPNWTDPDTLTPGTYTYVVTATDPAGNPSDSQPVSAIVIPPSLTAPRSLSANSPTNSVPHLTWQPPVTFAVTSWQIYRDGALLQPIPDASAGSFDDGTAAQGSHTYTVQALSGGTPGDMSSPVAVTYDTVAPALASATATANPSGSVSINWPVADDPTPGSGISSYVVRRGTSAPGDASGGTGICNVTPADTDCVDSTAKSGTSYGYAVFAVDAAGNKARREATVKAVDSQSPDAVANFKVVSFDRTYARLGWTVPALKGADADVTGYRVIKLRRGAKTPLSPNDGTVVCNNDDTRDNICDATGLTTGQKVTFAVYALDEVPNYSSPALISIVPHSVDKKPPHKPTKVRLTRDGLTYTLKWVSPRDRDLSKFRVTLYDKNPAPNPAKGKVVGQGRVLHATFTLKPGKRTYITLFALDVVGNFSKVSKLIVAPGTAVVPKSKKKKPVANKTVKKPVVKKPAKKPAVPVKPIPVEVTAKAENA